MAIYVAICLHSNVSRISILQTLHDPHVTTAPNIIAWSADTHYHTTSDYVESSQWWINGSKQGQRESEISGRKEVFFTAVCKAWAESSFAELELERRKEKISDHMILFLMK